MFNYGEVTLWPDAPYFAKANVIQMKNQYLSFSTVQFHHIEMRGIMLEGILKMDSEVCPLCLPCLAVPPFLLAHPKKK